MTQTIEVDLGKILERIEQKLERHIETTNESLTKIQVNQAKLEGKIDTLEVKLEEKTSSLKTGQDATNAKLNTQSTWLLSLLTGLTVGIIGLVAAVGKVVFFPNL